MSRFLDLVAVVERLRGEDGCAWDRAQTLESLRPYLLEEAYEVLHAIDHGDQAELKKELGDLLFIVLMMSKISADGGEFGIDEVMEAVAAKMIHRHPRVFNANAEQGLSSWEEQKSVERGVGSALDGVPQALPALLRAHRVTEKASRVGFDWPDRASVRIKMDEELAELDDAIVSGKPEEIAEEFGDVLFTLVNFGRFLPVGAEDALRLATDKFERRFRAVEQRVTQQGRSIHQIGLEELEAHWRAVKLQGRE